MVAGAAVRFREVQRALLVDVRLVWVVSYFRAVF
jgi:hypothetical protein